MKKLSILFTLVITVALVSCNQNTSFLDESLNPKGISTTSMAGGGNISLDELGCTFEFNSGDIQYDGLTNTGSYGPITWTYDPNTGSLTWSSTMPVTVAFVVKGGPAANLYFDGCSDCRTSNAVTMYVPINPNSGKPYGLSHIEFAYNLCTPPPQLVVAFKAVMDAGFVTSGAYITAYPFVLGGQYKLYLSGIVSSENEVGFLTVKDSDNDGKWEVLVDNSLNSNVQYYAPRLFVGEADDFNLDWSNYPYPNPKVIFYPFLNSWEFEMP